MTTFRFITVGENLGTRKLGEETRNKLLPLLLGEGQVVLDFEGVNVVSNSFADECLAKLLLIMPLEELKKKTTFRGLNDFARKNISVAFKRRYLALNSEKGTSSPVGNNEFSVSVSSHVGARRGLQIAGESFQTVPGHVTWHK